MEQRERIRTYLVYGDSGCGKSSFISQLKGVSTDNKLPECGGGGEAMTKEPGKVYVVEVRSLL
jgi:GTPase SAR1 family protein